MVSLAVPVPICKLILGRMIKKDHLVVRRQKEKGRKETSIFCFAKLAT